MNAEFRRQKVPGRDSPHGPPVLILAAGHGSRMGGPKAFKEHGGRTFLERILDRCVESRSPVVLTVDPIFRARIEALLSKREATLPVLVEADGLRPMLETTQAGLADPLPAEAPWGGGFWLWPVDAPFLSESGWARARAAVAQDAAAIWKLRVQGRTGHPIWFPGWSVEELRSGTWPDGLLGFLTTHKDRVRILPLEGEVIADFNTPASLATVPEL